MGGFIATVSIDRRRTVTNVSTSATVATGTLPLKFDGTLKEKTVILLVAVMTRRRCL